MADLLEPLRAALDGRYAVERLLGQGGMATVYLARDCRHDRPVAIKVLRPELAASLGADRFLREIKLAANLQHPNILALYDSGDAGGFLYYVMPLVEGDSLCARLDRESQLSVPDAIQLTWEASEALHCAHSRGIVHRDIKPENILIQEGHALVADFGIARAVTEAGGDKLTETGMAVGTPHYMSPEQALVSAHVDGRSDEYSLGCVTYEMLVGQPPLTGPTPWQFWPATRWRGCRACGSSGIPFPTRSRLQSGGLWRRRRPTASPLFGSSPMPCCRPISARAHGGPHRRHTGKIGEVLQSSRRRSLPRVRDSGHSRRRYWWR